MYSKKYIIKHLNLIADLLEFKGENVFKVNAFRNAANNIRSYEGQFSLLITENRLGEIKGIGKGIQPVIAEFFSAGKSLVCDELLASVPKGLPELFNIKGLGPKKVSQLQKELGIEDKNSLFTAIEENRLSALQGFGTKTQEKIKIELENLTDIEHLCLLDKGFELLTHIEAKLAEVKSILQFARTGEARRIREFFSEIEYVILLDDEADVISKISGIVPCVKDDAQTLNGILNNMFIKFHLTTNNSDFITKLFATTGDSAFLKEIKWEGQSGNSEAEIFSQLNLPALLPENREIEFLNSRFIKNYTPTELSPAQFKGHFHFHSIYSDGLNSVKEIADAAEVFGYTHSIVCDHSKSAFYAGGLTEEKIERQKKEIKALQQQGVKIFQGIESDILIDGTLDYPEDILKNFALVVASVHTRTNLDEEEMTARIIRAVENPYTDILAHPSGRLLLKREPYKVNMNKVIDACVKNDVAIEINANPKRLDIDWRFLFYAREKGARFAINPDAHATDQIAFVNFGIMIARKAGITSNEIINCLRFDDLVKFLNRKVQRTL